VKIEVSAPGKLVLLGEYAVLFGAPAVVMAVNRRARVELSPSESNCWTLIAPDLAQRPVGLDVGRGGVVNWHDNELGQGSFGLVERLLGELDHAGVVELTQLVPLAATLDTREFFISKSDSRYKLGLGSSAALTVALASALAAWAGDGRMPDLKARWLQTLVDCHRTMQGGFGSGIDVAASVLGGVFRFRLAEDSSVVAAQPLDLPADLQLLFIWTGRSASTSGFLERLEARRAVHPQGVDHAIVRLGELSEVGIAALEAAAVPAFLAAVDGFWDALEALSREIEMPILSEEHRQLRRLAAASGARYKPSGAGGGDVGIAFAADPVAMRETAARAEAEGFAVLDLGTDPRGFTVS
jgi:phosphomevalonate kinase